MCCKGRRVFCSSKLEGCWCHGDVWVQKRKHSARVSEVAADTGHRHCVWKGRQAAWWVSEGIAELIGAIKAAGSERLNALMLKLETIERAKVAIAIQQLKTKLVEIHQIKFEHWCHIPWKAMGVYCCEQSGSVARAKEILRECVRGFYQAVLDGLHARLHRASLRLFSPDRTIGAEIREWLVCDLLLSAFRNAFLALMEIALIPLVERNVESIHAILKHIGKATTNILPPYLCARVRESAHMHLLKTNASFHEFCLTQWRKRDLFDRLLQLLFSKEQLGDMTLLDKTRVVYQCSLESEYFDTADSRNAASTWAANVPSLHRLQDVVGEPERQCHLCVQSLFKAGATSLSLQRSLKLGQVGALVVWGSCTVHV